MADTDPTNTTTTTTTEPGAASAAATAPATQAAPPAEPATQATAPGATMSVHKHQREVAKIEAERDAAKAEAEGYKALKAEFEQWKAAQEAKEAEGELKAAGCIDTVAAAARLSEFGGDVAKLKEAAPYLFASEDATKSTGGTPKGAPGSDDIAKTIREGVRDKIGA